MSTPIAHDCGGRPLFMGTPVRFTHDIAHLYEDGKGGRWVVERLGDDSASVHPLADKAPPDAKSRMAACRVLQIRDTTTGNWAFAPSLWLVAAGETAAVTTEPPPNDLRELALVLFNNRNCGAGVRMDKLTTWAIDYVHRTNPPASEPAPEPIFPSGSMQKVVAALVALGELKEAAAYSTVDIVDAIGRLSERNHKRIAELEQTLAEARKALGGVG